MEESRIMARNAEGNMENYDGRPCVAAMDLGTNSNRLLIVPAGDGTRHLFVYGFCGDAKAL